MPTLLRKLEADWRFAEPRLEDQVEDSAFSHPLSEFLPRATFADLDVSEVAIRLPGAEVRHEFLTVSHAMYETCPGRVSKRFAVRPGERGYWHPFSPNLIGGEVRATPSQNHLFPIVSRAGARSPASQHIPTSAGLAVAPRDPRTRDSSYATWEWDSYFPAAGTDKARPLPVSPCGSRSERRSFERVEALMHQDSGSIEVTRLAQGCRYEILPDRGSASRRGLLKLAPDATMEGGRFQEGMSDSARESMAYGSISVPSISARFLSYRRTCSRGSAPITFFIYFSRAHSSRKEPVISVPNGSGKRP